MLVHAGSICNHYFLPEYTKQNFPINQFHVHASLNLIQLKTHFTKLFRKHDTDKPFEQKITSGEKMFHKILN